ncbi:E3 ubiquitin-protein ligase WAV3-like [Phragmites australis]|uniref:E3 ubiquitin-protein ligase WAV3-like n=1 Tax=Phragmites australis TaxID=29695 RepID=UPI002D76509E|nr:E3 ubiquitin-protein ligase WAV3-like [Phragmites australis]XP_062225038.1 E3 ubiquitin-protein ligase WAV3-like [Phragmites australis]
MGTGWRRALCTSVQRDDHDDSKSKKRRPHDATTPSPRAGGFFSAVIKGTGSGSNPSTPTLRCRTKPLQEPAESAPVTPPSAPALMRKHRMPLLQALSAPSSPRSPSRFALLKASLLPTKSRCGVCSRGVKSGGSSAVFTAECSHSFHFPCIAAHARSSSAAGVLSCPVCASPWRQAPFLASLRLHCSFHDGRKAPPPASGAPKLYDDDEPLLAPKAAANGSGFNPIPEADEDDGDEEAEFRGFFPRPRTSGLAVTVAPETALVSSGRRHGKYVVAVKAKAPGGLRSSSATPRRAPIDLVTVLDVSQGMMGEKLQMLKRGMRLVVASLGPADRLSIVAFSGAAKRLLPLRRMTRQGQRSARQIVDRLVVCATAQGQEQAQAQTQSVCVGDALRKATKVLEDRRDRNPVATVMLLSDTQQQQQDSRKQGNDHHAVRRPAVAPATRFTHVEIPIGPAGNTPLVAKEEEKASEEPPVEHAFAKCLGGLVSVVMQEVHLELLFPTGEITAVYSCGPGQQAVSLAGGNGGGAVSIRLGEMYAEEERELLVELRAPLGAQHNHPHSLSARCSYRDPASQDTVRGAEQPLLLPQLRDGSSWSRRLHDLFVATRAVAESRRLAELQDLATAIHLLSSARALVLQSPPTQQQQELVGSLDTELSDMRWRRSQHHQQQPLTPTSRSGRRGDAETTPVGTPRGGEPLTPTSAWRAAEQLAKVAIMRKSMNRVSDLHGFENARF